MDLPTRAELFDIGAQEVLSRSLARPPEQRLSAEEVYTEGSDINIAIASSSAMAEEVIRHLCLRLGAKLLDSAEGEDLDREILDRTNGEVPRKTASAAVGSVQMTRASGAMLGGTIEQGARLRSTSGVEFEVTSATTIGAGNTGPVTVPVQAIEAGLHGNVAAGTVTEFVQTPFDSALQITNAEPMAGGDYTESDARYRERGRDFFRTARRGILSAIEFGALAVTGVRQATAEEEVDSAGDPTGRVRLYIADAQGQGNQALVTAVLLGLREYRGCGVVVDVVASNPVYEEIQYRLRFEAGVDSTLAFDAVRQATLSAVNALRPQQTLTEALLLSVARSVEGVIVLDDAVVVPVGDVVPASGQVIRTRLDLITAE